MNEKFYFGQNSELALICDIVYFIMEIVMLAHLSHHSHYEELKLEYQRAIAAVNPYLLNATLRKIKLFSLIIEGKRFNQNIFSKTLLW
ncbi:MAG: hypothetical protein AB4372_09250 [Xenococcus sp. (in: cyanobacteria)]